MMYKFRLDLRGHSSDVRCISNGEGDVIVSGSRDRTCRLWNSDGGNYHHGLMLCGHTDFISSICYISPCELFPDGLIVTGSNDHTICVYSPKFPEILFKLISHSDTVCCVNPSSTGTNLLSSSWDSNIIMWDLLCRCIRFKITGNNKPIWSVIQMSCGTILAACADKVIRAYSPIGEFIRSYYGHSDVVRCLYPVDDSTFLSCGNDGHVLRWNTQNKSCIGAIDTVSHFLYSVTYFAKKNVTVYCGERGCVYINTGSGSEIINVPSTSVWCATVLPNKDIAVGCSDGVIRVYTCDPNRYADESVMKVYLNELKTFSSLECEEKKKDLRCPYLNDLSGPEKLNAGGKVSNEIIFVRQGFLAIMYSWSVDRWMELARRKGTYKYDVSQKKLHNGKAYDYLFPINVDDHQPNLILPITLGDDLLDKVMDFLNEYDLATHFGEIIYNHIANSVKDDFLKASLLESSLHGISSESSVLTSLNSYFPKRTYIWFEKGNIDQITGKLMELAANYKIAISEENIDILKKVTDVNYKCIASQCENLLNFLNWPREALFPILDLLRLAIRNESFHNIIFTSVDTINTIIPPLICHLQYDVSPINQLMSLKVFCNMFAYPPGRKIISDEFSNIIYSLSCIIFPEHFSTTLQVAASTLALNLILLTETSSHRRIDCLKCIAVLLDRFSDNEARYRAFIGVGTLVSYEGSIFIPKPLVAKLRAMSQLKELQGHIAQHCLNYLLLCFQD